jgi:2-polyprenyl-6-methoxyphenol hydroxylase-like FAD-dependent oxidoreductase
VTRVAIVGAGIGGLAAALALRNCDVVTVVLEQADHPKPVRAGIQLTPNAIQVRARSGALDAIVDAASSRNHWTSSRAGGATRCCQPAGRAGSHTIRRLIKPAQRGLLAGKRPHRHIRPRCPDLGQQADWPSGISLPMIQIRKGS